MKNNKFFWIIILIILTIPTFFSLLRPGYFFMQDDLQAFRVLEMGKCFSDFQIPCRWVPDGGYGYGYPQFLYYPPSVYYLGAVFHLLGLQIIDSTKLLFTLGMLLSTILMFIFLKSFFEGESKEKVFSKTTLPALAGALLYTYVPYKALEIYVRGALSEFWSLVFYPLIFLFIYQLVTKKLLKYLILFSLSVGGLMITHNLMTLIFVPIAFVWCLTLLIIKKEWKTLPKIILGTLLGFGLAAFFTLPVIFESKYAHLETLVGGYFDYRQHFVNLERLFISNHWGYGSSGLNQDNDLTLSTGQIHWMVGVLALILGVILFKKQKKLSILVFVLSSMELLVLFMIHQKSSFIWEHLSPLAYLQFPWRFLNISIFLLSFLGSMATFFIVSINQKYGRVFVLVILVGSLVLHGQFFQPKNWLQISDQDKFSHLLWEKQLTISIFDYLPIFAKFPPNKKAPLEPEILDGEVKIVNYQKGSNYQLGKLYVVSKSTIRLPLFDFPGMKVWANGQKINHWHDDCRNEDYCLGLITFNLLPGQYQIKAKLEDTPIRSLSNIITLVSIIVTASLFFLGKKYEKIFS